MGVGSIKVIKAPWLLDLNSHQFELVEACRGTVGLALCSCTGCIFFELIPLFPAFQFSMRAVDKF